MPVFSLSHCLSTYPTIITECPAIGIFQLLSTVYNVQRKLQGNLLNRSLVGSKNLVKSSQVVSSPIIQKGLKNNLKVRIKKQTIKSKNPPPANRRELIRSVE